MFFVKKKLTATATAPPPFTSFDSSNESHMALLPPNSGSSLLGVKSTSSTSMTNDLRVEDWEHLSASVTSLELARPVRGLSPTPSDTTTNIFELKQPNTFPNSEVLRELKNEPPLTCKETSVCNNNEPSELQLTNDKSSSFSLISEDKQVTNVSESLSPIIPVITGEQTQTHPNVNVCDANESAPIVKENQHKDEANRCNAHDDPDLVPDTDYCVSLSHATIHSSDLVSCAMGNPLPVSTNDCVDDSPSEEKITSSEVMNNSQSKELDLFDETKRNPFLNTSYMEMEFRKQIKDLDRQIGVGVTAPPQVCDMMQSGRDDDHPYCQSRGSSSSSLSASPVLLAHQEDDNESNPEDSLFEMKNNSSDPITTQENNPQENKDNSAPSSSSSFDAMGRLAVLIAGCWMISKLPLSTSPTTQSSSSPSSHPSTSSPPSVPDNKKRKREQLYESVHNTELTEQPNNDVWWSSMQFYKIFFALWTCIWLIVLPITFVLLESHESSLFPLNLFSKTSNATQTSAASIWNTPHNQTSTGPSVIGHESANFIYNASISTHAFSEHSTTIITIVWYAIGFLALLTPSMFTWHSNYMVSEMLSPFLLKGKSCTSLKSGQIQLKEEENAQDNNDVSKNDDVSKKDDVSNQDTLEEAAMAFLHIFDTFRIQLFFMFPLNVAFLGVNRILGHLLFMITGMMVVYYYLKRGFVFRKSCRSYLAKVLRYDALRTKEGKLDHLSLLHVSDKKQKTCSSSSSAAPFTTNRYLHLCQRLQRHMNFLSRDCQTKGLVYYIAQEWRVIVIEFLAIALLWYNSSNTVLELFCFTLGLFVLLFCLTMTSYRVGILHAFVFLISCWWCHSTFSKSAALNPCEWSCLLLLIPWLCIEYKLESWGRLAVSSEIVNRPFSFWQKLVSLELQSSEQFRSKTLSSEFTNSPTCCDDGPCFLINNMPVPNDQTNQKTSDCILMSSTPQLQLSIEPENEMQQTQDIYEQLYDSICRGEEQFDQFQTGLLAVAALLCVLPLLLFPFQTAIREPLLSTPFPSGNGSFLYKDKDAANQSSNLLLTAINDYAVIHEPNIIWYATSSYSNESSNAVCMSDYQLLHKTEHCYQILNAPLDWKAASYRALLPNFSRFRIIHSQLATISNVREQRLVEELLKSHLPTLDCSPTSNPLPSDQKSPMCLPGRVWTGGFYSNTLNSWKWNSLFRSNSDEEELSLENSYLWIHKNTLETKLSSLPAMEETLDSAASPTKVLESSSSSALPFSLSPLISSPSPYNPKISEDRMRVENEYRPYTYTPEWNYTSWESSPVLSPQLHACMHLTPTGKWSNLHCSMKLPLLVEFWK